MDKTSITHEFDIAVESEFASETIRNEPYFTESQEVVREYDCAGTVGTAGTWGGTFGTIGSWGCCC